MCLQVSKTSNAVLGEEGEDNDLLKMQGGSVSTSLLSKPKFKGYGGAETVHTVEAARECQLEFFRRMPGVCQNCGAHNPAIKKYAPALSASCCNTQPRPTLAI